METAIRRSLEPLDEGSLPFLQEIAAADEAIRARERFHYARYRDLLEEEAKMADEYLRGSGNGLLPGTYVLIKDALDQAKAAKDENDLARAAAKSMSGDAASVIIAGTAEALRNPVVVDRLAQLNAVQRLLQMVAQFSDS